VTETALSHKAKNALIRSMLSKAPHMPALAQLMGSEKCSDLKLVCEGHEFRVHKAIVSLKAGAATLDVTNEVGIVTGIATRLRL